MTFWLTQQGPRYDGDAPRDARKRCIGELVCPGDGGPCENILARLYAEPDGTAVHAWVPAPGAPADPTGKRVGWLFYTIVNAEMPDEENARLHCWRGHHGLVITARECKMVAGRFKGRRNRHVLGRGVSPT